MTDLAVREMVLYKHGVGFFVRQGTVSGEEITLTFRKDEINDVLKSLAVFDKAGGKIRGIHYQTPMDREARLASSSIRLSQANSLSDLLRDLRGRQAVLNFETTPGTLESVTGRIIGIDFRAETIAKLTHQTQQDLPEPVALPETVSVLADDGEVRVFRFETLRTLRVKDAQSQHDLTYFLDTSLTEDDRRTIRVRLTEGEHDLSVYYVAPSPTWRVSYRLVAETDEDGSTGRALLQGWGLFDNRLEEDLDNVRVTLVAGQPISFIYDLYTSRIPERPVVKDEARVAPGPVEFEGVQRKSNRRRSRPAAGLMSRAAPAMAQMDAMESESQVMYSFGSMAEAEDSVQTDTETKATGETFQYIVTTPVTVKRGESALVPIINSVIQYERELLYNRSKLPDFPVMALRFENDTDLTLERGPVTVVEDSDYKGEAVIPFTKESGQVYLACAVERGIRISEKHEQTREIYQLRIDDAMLIIEEYQTMMTVYSINNTTTTTQTITLERRQPSAPSEKLFDTREPDVVTQHEWRWRVTASAGELTAFTVKVRRPKQRRVELMKLSYRQLVDYLKNQWLDQALFDELKSLLDTQQQIRDWRQEITELEAERNDIYAQQEQLRKNLGALQPTGQEATLRNRLLTQLETTQDRLDAINTTIEDNRAKIDGAEQQIKTQIAALK